MGVLCAAKNWISLLRGQVLFFPTYVLLDNAIRQVSISTRYIQKPNKSGDGKKLFHAWFCDKIKSHFVII